jgi:hypothetical protein
VGKVSTDLDDFVVAEREAAAAMELLREKRLSDFNLLRVLVDQVPNPKGGFFYIGPHASGALGRIAARSAKANPDLKMRVSPAAFKRAIFREFGGRLSGAREALTSTEATMMVADAVAALRGSLQASVTHFVACVLSHESTVSRFEVGPVVFQTAASFADEIEEHCQKSDWKEGWDDARRVFASHGWVASVTLENFEREKSAEVAAHCIETALNIVRLFVGGNHAQRFRLGGGYRLAEEGARIVRRSDGSLSPWLSRVSERASISDDWVAKCLQGNSEGWVKLAGSLIQSLRSGRRIPALYSRLLVGLWWYGEGVAEPHDHAKVVRFATAMEAFLGTPSSPDAKCVACGKAEGIVEQLARRAGSLCGHETSEGAAKWECDVRVFYNARSRLVHGEWAPFDAKVRKFALMGERLARRVLLEGLSWSHYVSEQNFRMSSREIGRYFDEVLPNWPTKQPAASQSEARQGPEGASGPTLG